jgi:hypothetical protein
MVQALRLQRIGQRLHHVLLPDHLRKIARAVLAGQHDVGEAANRVRWGTKQP